MPNKLKAAFDDPRVGWITLTVQDGDESISITASYVRDSLLELTFALHNLLVNQGQAVVTWVTEPVEYEMRFERSTGSIRLELREFPDSRRSAVPERLLLAIAGQYDEVCLPFWRALRALQGRFSAEELQERWQNPFPSREVEKLTQVIKARVP